MKDTFPIREAAKRLGVTVKTLQRWDRSGRLVPSRTKTGRRSYTEQQIQAFKFTQLSKSIAEALK